MYVLSCVCFGHVLYSLIFLYTLCTILMGSGRGMGVNICIIARALSYHFIKKVVAFLNMDIVDALITDLVRLSTD